VPNLIDRRTKIVRDVATETAFRAWLTTKPTDEAINANVAVGTPWCRFLRENGRAHQPEQHGFYWWEKQDLVAYHEGSRVPTLVEAAQNFRSNQPQAAYMTYGQMLAQFDLAVEELKTLEKQA
jgi:hypothetical protein